MGKATHHMSGRVTYSILETLGLPDLVVETLEELEELLVKLVVDTEYYMGIRKHLIKTIQGEETQVCSTSDDGTCLVDGKTNPLDNDYDDDDYEDEDYSPIRRKVNPFWDMKLYVHHLEIGYAKIWENYLAKRPATHMNISAYL